MDNTLKFWIEIIAAGSIPICIIALIVERTITNKGIGYRALQFLAIGIVLPTIIILSLEEVIQGEVVATIIAAILGYLFGTKDTQKGDAAAIKKADGLRENLKG